MLHVEKYPVLATCPGYGPRELQRGPDPMGLLRKHSTIVFRIQWIGLFFTFLNPMNPGPDEIFMAKTPGTWPKPEIVQHATFAILHLCVAIAICSYYHVMIPFMDSIRMPYDIRYTLI